MSIELDKIIETVKCEVKHATSLWPGFNSAHEGYAVLAEEVDELWDHVKKNQKRRDIDAMRKEAIQVAAMAIRFAHDICDEINGRK
jgi:NTP pyrophosphatase (non-canonical NTP hydrolase)